MGMFYTPAQMLALRVSAQSPLGHRLGGRRVQMGVLG